MARLYRSIALLGLALAGCADAPGAAADAAVDPADASGSLDLGSPTDVPGPSDLGGLDAPRPDDAPPPGDQGLVVTDTPPADVPVVVLDGGAVVRSCRTSFSLNLGRPARSVSVAGEWNSFSTTANPLTPMGATGVFRVELDLPAGDYGYKFVVDGDQYITDPTNIVRKYVGGVENSRVIVPDCNLPLLTPVRNAASGAGELELDVRYTDGAEGRGVDPSSVRVTMSPGVLPPDAVSFDRASGLIRVRARGLARTRYSLRFNASTASGRRAAELFVPMWIEETPFEWTDGPMYFVFTDRFRNGNPLNDGRVGGIAPIADWNGGDFAGITAALREGYFDQLGVRSLWLSPVNANTHNVGRGGDGRGYGGYHGYWPNQPRDTDSHWGSLDELRALNEEAHRHGIRVLYDMVNNQLHREHPYYQMHQRDGWFNGDGSCVCGGPMCSWDDRPLDCWFTNYLPDVNWTNMAVADQMLDDGMWWLNETNADGFRVDAVKHMNFLATSNLRARLNAWDTGNARPYTVGETFTGGDGYDLVRRYIGDNALHAQFDFPLYWAIRSSLARNNGSMGDLEAAVQRSERAYGDFPMSPFLGNHDIERFISEAAGQLVGDTRELGYNNPPPPPPSDEPYERMAIAFTFTLTQRGVPLIYYGDEVGLPGAADPDNRRPMRFGADLNPREQRLLAHVRAVGRLRGTHRGLQRGARRSLHTDGDGYVYARGVGAEVAIVALNRGTTSRAVSVRLPAELGVADGTVLRDALGDGSVTVTGGAIEVPLRVRGSSIFIR
ncbi:MAG: alpha-amylase family glycosyl hydrolase [Deltaproteobacteria bacterium]|nr:alpha-amylase family glycosyl hydrolase [Myxococcales bacterium]MDP3221038.1 alpha-amylase family glycosyl hydrolase [Deltaproteobacteria bacterium]